jgi:ADP-ribose pyrophosphatase
MAKSSRSHHMRGWQVTERQVLLDHPWVRFVVDTLTRGGDSKPYFYLESPVDAVATVALTDGGELVLTRQYRHPLGRVLIDLPAGRMSPGEEPSQAARRELVEETGYLVGHIQPLGRYSPFPGSLKVTAHLFFACDLRPGPQRLDPGEELEVILRPVDAVVEGILSGEYLDTSLQLGVLLARAKGLL